MSVKIIADSSSDVSQDLAKEWGIRILPLKIRFEDEEYLDGVTLSNKEFYEKLIENNTLPKTSQISPADYEDAFREALKDNDEVVCLTISSGVSGTVQSATIAAGEFDGKVYVVDSKQFCISYFILVEYAVRLRDEGKSAKEIAEEIEAIRDKSTVLSVFDTLEYLKAGGRLSSAAAFVGEVLSIKPVITITDGIVEVIGKARGSKKGNNILISKVEEVGGIDFSMPYCVGYTGLSSELLEKYLSDSAALYPDDLSKIRRVSVGATIGTYAGPGAIAVAFFPKNR